MRKCLRLCVFAPEILLRLASVCMGEWVNSVERMACFLVAKNLIFKIRKNLRLQRGFRVCVVSFAFASFASFAFVPF